MSSTLKKLSKCKPVDEGRWPRGPAGRPLNYLDDTPPSQRASSDSSLHGAASPLSTWPVATWALS